MSKYAVVTTFHAKGYEQYAQKFIKTFTQQWPTTVNLYVYTEDCKIFESAPNLIIRDLHSSSQPLVNFKNKRVRVLVATDIAARGIDIDQLSHVLNYELPNVPETYVHRIGRTGRAGASGIALSFCSREEKAYLRDIEKLIKKSVPVQKWEGSSIAESANNQSYSFHKNENHGSSKRLTIQKRDRILV